MIDMYESITLPVLTNMLDSAKWVLSTDTNSMGELDWLISCYSAGNAIAGYTDYKDHRKLGISIENYQQEVYETITGRLCQAGSYYNMAGVAFDIVLIKLGSSGWSADPIWSDNSICHFAQSYKNAAAIGDAMRAKTKAEQKERAKQRRLLKKQQNNN